MVVLRHQALEAHSMYGGIKLWKHVTAVVTLWYGGMEVWRHVAAVSTWRYEGMEASSSGDVSQLW